MALSALWGDRITQSKNVEKYEVYKSMNENLSKAMRSGFYYQAIFIEYAILEDRCSSVLKYAGVKYQDKEGKDIKISTKLRKIADNPAFHVPYVRQRIPLDLIAQLTTWKQDRDQLIHALAKIPYDHDSVQEIATRGQELVRLFSTRVQSVNRYNNKIQQK